MAVSHSRRRSRREQPPGPPFFNNLPNDAIYLPLAIAKDNDGATASVAGNRVVVGSPPANAPPVTAINNVSVNGDCVTVTGATSDPEGELAAAEVELGTRGRSLRL